MSASAPPAPIFSGRTAHALDSKNRVSIPSRWRRGEADEFFVMLDRTNTFLRAMPPAEFRAVADKIELNTALTPKDRSIFKRRFYSGAVQVFADKQGRMLLPENFCELLDLRGEIVFVGVHDTFEVWNKQRLAEADAKEEGTYDRVAELAGL